MWGIRWTYNYKFDVVIGSAQTTPTYNFLGRALTLCFPQTKLKESQLRSLGIYSAAQLRESLLFYN